MKNLFYAALLFGVLTACNQSQKETEMEITDPETEETTATESLEMNDPAEDAAAMPTDTSGVNDSAMPTDTATY